VRSHFPGKLKVISRIILLVKRPLMVHFMALPPHVLTTDIRTLGGLGSRAESSPAPHSHYKKRRY